ncbi:MAG TPA: hypothetical protein VFQ70_02760 [Candidatus Saccharimonadaceae bacterium]|nr:hypothetical protein [Candidatus Saccharimonadaceae bacterium]
MYKSLRKSFQTWYESTNERQKMQHTYLTAVVVLIVIAGLVGLVNYQLSQTILALAFGAVALWLINLVVWALLQSLVLLPLSKSQPPARTQRKRTPRK